MGKFNSSQRQDDQAANLATQETKQLDLEEQTLVAQNAPHKK